MIDPRKLDGLSVGNLYQSIRDPHEIYDRCKDIDGFPGEGTFNLAVCRTLAFYGMRHASRQLFYEPLHSYDSVVTALQLRSQLEFQPRLFGDHLNMVFVAFPSARSAAGGVLEMPHQGEAPIGGHAVALVDVEDGGQALVFANSWGRAWGDHGFGYMSREYFERHILDVWLMRRARWGPSSFNYKRLTTAQNHQEFARSWMLENPRWITRTRINGSGHRLVTYETLSVEEGCRAEVIEIQDGRGLRLAWAELFHLPQQKGGVTLAKEFFVWPGARRRGYGTVLEELATEVAVRNGAPELHLLFHEMDAQIQVRAAGRRFAQRLGYRWRWRRSRIPNTVGVAEKRL